MALIDPGTYPAQPLEAELTETKKGDPCVVVSFEIAHGQRISWWGYFTDKTQRRTIESLRHCGWDGDNLGDLSSISPESPTVELVIEHEEYEGKVRARVQWVNRLGGGIATAPMAADKRAAFAARMKGLVIEVDKSLAVGAKRQASAAPRGNGSASALPPSRQPDPIADRFGEEDIPF